MTILTGVPILAFSGAGDRAWRRWLDGGLVVSRAYRWRPSVDVFEVEDGALVRVEAAGLSDDDFEVTYEHDRLVIEGARAEPMSRRPLACHQVEIARGSFRTEVRAPWPVDARRIEVEYRAGIISVFLPRRAG